MPSLSVRQVDEETVAAIRQRAARRGVSMEEEIRQILRDAAAESPEGLGTLLTEAFRPSYEFGEAFEPPPREHSEPIDLR